MEPVTDLSYAPNPRSLPGLEKAVGQCRRCPLYAKATQAVAGQGPVLAAIMLVGEQPGNDEDLAGQPFVGPAGRLLDKALGESGLERGSVYVTNAVKHFKFVPRGKRRLHQRPNAEEISICRWWIDIERKLVKPRLIVAMGATAARSIAGKPVVIVRRRGLISETDGVHLMVTIHPSWLLRMPDPRLRRAEFEAFVADLKRARAFVL
ncbi:MAG: UdgX family uracil-DNA binding protein [Alphaproteobacteria bacterium]|nr:UdgX family uracil-DNA binding protein [Alphaproteobacteria bacterium]